MEEEDEWDYWVYRARVRSYLEGEKSSDFMNIHGSLSSNRVTEDWKTGIWLSGSYNESNFEFEDDKIKDVSRSQRLGGEVIKSLDEHWSIGMWAQVNSSTYSNIDYSISATPAIEYNFFPYSESTRRQLRLQYKVRPIYNNYNSETIYLKSEEKLVQEILSVTLELIEPWGSISTTLSGSHYFHDFELNNLRLFTFVSLKLVKGLSLDFDFSISIVHDQISLRKGSYSIEEVLLRQRELETQFTYWGSIGVSVYFGSIYNNIVNPRFGD
jgi:hypothetical protein